MLDTLLKSLNIDPKVLGINIVVFVLLVLIMDRIYWRKVMNHLDKRRDDITHAYQTVDDTRVEMENLRTEYQSRLSRIEADARAQIQQTVREAQHQREAVIAEARQQSEMIMSKGVADIDAERKQAIQTTRERLVGVSGDAIEKVLGNAVVPAQRSLVEEYIAQRANRS